MPTQADHAHKLALLSPDGPYFEGVNYFALLTALAGEPSRVDALAEQLLTDFLPDTIEVNGTLIDTWADLLGLPGDCDDGSWATYTDAQKAAAIRSRLKGRSNPSQPDLELEFQELLDDPNVVLIGDQFPMLAAGVGAVGAPLRGPQWPAAWLLEYMPDVLDPSADDLDAWTQTGATAISNSSYQSPATEMQTAADVFLDDPASGEMKADLTLANAADHEVYFTLWVRTQGSPELSALAISFETRDGGTSVPAVFDLTPTWVKLTYRANIGVGGTQPRVVIATQESGGASYRMSWAWAGSVQAAAECRAEDRMPLNTAGVHGVIEEYSTAV